MSSVNWRTQLVTTSAQDYRLLIRIAVDGLFYFPEHLTVYKLGGCIFLPAQQVLLCSLVFCCYYEKQFSLQTSRIKKLKLFKKIMGGLKILMLTYSNQHWLNKLLAAALTNLEGSRVFPPDKRYFFCMSQLTENSTVAP